MSESPEPAYKQAKVDIDETFASRSKDTPADPSASRNLPPTPEDSASHRSDVSQEPDETRLDHDLPPSTPATHYPVQIRGPRSWINLYLKRYTPFAAILALSAVIIWLFFRVSVQPAAATAVVQPSSAGVYKDSESDSVLDKLRRGQTVNVLKLPRSRDQEWILVQFVDSGRARRPGYMHVADLANWDSKDAASKLRLMVMFSAAETGSDIQLQAELRALDNLVRSNSASSIVPEAELEMARLNIASARRLKAEGRPIQEVSSRLQDAQVELRISRRGPQLASASEDLVRQVESLSAPESAEQPKDKDDKKSSMTKTEGNGRLLTRAQIEWRLRLANVLRDQGNYDRADRYISEVLRADPHDSDALLLRQKVREAKQFEDRLRQ